MVHQTGPIDETGSPDETCPLARQVQETKTGPPDAPSPLEEAGPMDETGPPDGDWSRPTAPLEDAAGLDAE